MEILWQIEEKLWTGGVAEFERHLAPGCVMVFPQIGLLSGREAVCAAVADAPRWQEVQMRGQHLIERAELCLIAYHALATRGAGAAYDAWCSSVYVPLSSGGWGLLHHQQSPVT